MIADLVTALEGHPGRVELRGMLSTLRDRWSRLAPSAARDALAADGRVLARAVEREAGADHLAAAVEVVRRWHAAMMSSDDCVGRPMCARGCVDRIVLVDEPGVRCALCDGPVNPTLVVAQRWLPAALEHTTEAPTVLGDRSGAA